MTEEEKKSHVLETVNRWKYYFSEENQKRLKELEREIIENSDGNLHIGCRGDD